MSPVGARPRGVEPPTCDQQEGDFGADFFDDVDDAGHSHDEEEELGPLREGKAKSGGKVKGKAGGKAKPKSKAKARGRQLEPRTSQPRRRCPSGAGMAMPRRRTRNYAQLDGPAVCVDRRAAAVSRSDQHRLRRGPRPPRRPSFERGGTNFRIGDAVRLCAQHEHSGWPDGDGAMERVPCDRVALRAGRLIWRANGCVSVLSKTF